MFPQKQIDPPPITIVEKKHCLVCNVGRPFIDLMFGCLTLCSDNIGGMYRYWYHGLFAVEVTEVATPCHDCRLCSGTFAELSDGYQGNLTLFLFFVFVFPCTHLL